MAIKEWLRLKDGAMVSLERALVAFDMFVLHGRKGDFNEVCVQDSVAYEGSFTHRKRYQLSSIGSRNKFAANLKTLKKDRHG